MAPLGRCAGLRAGAEGGGVRCHLAALGYCLLAGWAVPAQRTFFMLATVATAAWLRLGAGPLATLALAAFVVCPLEPWSVVAPGFW